MQAIHGAEVDLDDGRHLTLLVETQEGWRNLCRIITRAHAHARDHDEPPPAVPLETLEEHAAGLVCLSGCARHGVHDEPTLRAAARRLRAATACASSCSGPSSATTARATGALAGLARAARAGDGGDGQRPRARARARAAAGRVRRAAQPHDARRVRAAAARQHVARAGLAGGDGGALRGPSAGGGGGGGAGRAAALRPHDRPRLPLPGRGGPGGRPHAGRAVLDRIDERYPPGSPHRAAAHARLERGAARDRRGSAWPASSSCTATCSSSRARWRWRCAGPDSARALLPPGRGRGSSVSSIVCYLTGLSHIDPVANDLFLGRFLNEELTALPDIDLDFPRDIREVLIPRIHDRYGRERSALVAAFPTFRSRGAIRELGKVLGLPPGELERVARGAEPWAVRGVTADVESALGLEPGGPPAPLVDPDSRAPFAMSIAEWQAMVNGRRPDHDEARAGRRAAPRRAARPLGVAGAAVRRGLRAAAPPLPALGRDDRLDPAADRLLPGAAGGDGGPPAVPVGQGLLRGRGLPQDRPARAGDALVRRAGGRADRAHARRARRPLADPVRRPGDLLGHPGGRHDGRLPDREPRADAVAAPHAARRRSTTSRSRSRSCGPGRSSAARSTRTSRAASAMREDPDFVVPYDHPSLEPVLQRHARDDHLPGPGDRGRDGLRGLLAGRGRGAAAGDEPQALGGGDRGLPPALHRGRRCAPTAPTRRPPSASTR